MIIAAALSIQDPRERPLDKQAAAAEAHARFADKESDFLSYLRLWDYLAERQDALSSNQFRKLCRAEFLNFLRIREWQDIHGQLRQVIRNLDGRRARAAPAPSPPGERDEKRHRKAIHQSLLAGLLSHIGLKGGPRDEYQGARAARFAIAPGSVLFKSGAGWVMAAELVETTRLWARVVARIEPEWAERLGAHLVKRTYSEPHWDSKRGEAMAYERVTLYGLPVVTSRKVSYNKVDAAGARDLFIRLALVEGDWRTPHAFWTENRRLVDEVRGLARKVRRTDVLVDDEVLDRLLRQADRPRGHLRPAPSTPGGNGSGSSIPTCSASPGSCSSTRPPAPSTRPPTRTSGATGTSGSACRTCSTPAPTPTASPSTSRCRSSTSSNRPPSTGRSPGCGPTSSPRSSAPSPRRYAGASCPSPTTPGRPSSGSGRRTGRCSTRWPGSWAASPATPSPRAAGSGSGYRPTSRIRYLVEDEAGRPLAAGKDLGALQEQLAERAEAGLAVAASTYERDGLHSWTLGSLPREVDVTWAGFRRRAYPALVDQGDSVAVRVFSTPAGAGAGDVGRHPAPAPPHRGQPRPGRRAPPVQRHPAGPGPIAVPEGVRPVRRLRPVRGSTSCWPISAGRCGPRPPSPPCGPA